MNAPQEKSPVPTLPLSKATLLVLEASKQGARELNHPCLWPEHLLLGLAENLLVKALFRQCNSGDPITQPDILSYIEFIQGRWTSWLPEKLIIGERVDKIINRADEQARGQGQLEITPEDILEAIIIEGDDVTTEILRSLGILGKLKERLHLTAS